MRVRVTSDALQDVQDSHDFYDRQEQGLGSYFRRCIEQDLQSLRTTAGIHSQIHGYLHVNSKIFHSIFYYRMEQQTAVVMAILDARIDPSARDRVLEQRG
ncbi:MAG: hypothetical protein K9N47_15505 [Prosthecobacter sp.]|uniref:hypothetical protein n=1 Tax=Prosthecobacter sp. TaxID=1965333 RepID=UPI0025F980C3|nr:hypothetical protein [Prosthecobacter sp.]MCF7787535.1 hypothetical protein [Prosthecobacter sp.]